MTSPRRKQRNSGAYDQTILYAYFTASARILPYWVFISKYE
jgi:hypothetical protein